MRIEWFERGVCFPKGFRAAGIACGIKGGAEKDLALLAADGPCRCAAVFTTNKVKAAPVIVSAERVKKGVARAVIVNSGNANACTGEKGILDAKEMARQTAEVLGIPEDEVLVFSTGVIGVSLPMEKIRAGIKKIVDFLVEDDLSFTEAIMTTDSRPKRKAAEITVDGQTFRIGGSAKGAGMIHPFMATMLAFITTDAALEADELKDMLAEAVELSFNRISVDGDRSTNDSVVVLSNPKVELDPKGKEAFKNALVELCQELALMIVRDGEGATKCVKVTVKGARSAVEARLACEKIVTSNLFKTALFGEDPNWGRIMAALGASGIAFRPELVDIYFENVKLVSGGLYAGGRAEEEAKRIMQNTEFEITVELKVGDAEYYMWTTDLTYDYIRMNAEYRS